MYMYILAFVHGKISDCQFLTQNWRDLESSVIKVSGRPSFIPGKGGDFSHHCIRTISVLHQTSRVYIGVFLHEVKWLEHHPAMSPDAEVMNMWNLNLHIHLCISVAWCLGAGKLHFYGKFENSEMKKKCYAYGQWRNREMEKIM
jgi:hypothetical protein